MPRGSWVMWQTWYNLLFAHWPIAPEAMQRALPPELEPHLFEGQAWIGVVPFGMSRVYPRYTLPVPWLSDFLELNVRTYVARDGEPGVFFFSLDAANPLAVALARGWYRLPYFNARMSLREAGDWIEYRSTRTHSGAPPAEFAGRYRPTGPVYQSQPGSLDYWLTERYCLYTVSQGRLYRGEIHHGPWPLQPAEAEIGTNTMVAPTSLRLPDAPPLLHFARSIEIVAWQIQPLARRLAHGPRGREQ
jgi:uncharacterized protein YqjF (DUF2071 family)